MPDIVGIAVQGRAIRGVEAKVSRSGRCTVLRTGEVRLPDATVEAGQLRDVEKFADALRELWDVAGFRSKRVRIGIDGRIAVVRRTELPSLGAEKLRKAAGYDIAELLNYPITEAVFDVDEIERIDRGGTPWARALVVAVQESALDDLASAARHAGLRLHGTDLVAEALARAVRAVPGVVTGAVADSGIEPATDSVVAVAECEDSVTNVVVRDASGVLFARTLNVGVGETSISIADELESALAQLSGDDQGMSLTVSDAAVGVSTVVEGIRRTLSYYTTELDQRPIDRVIVAGARGEAAGLLASLEQTLAVSAHTAEPSVPWTLDEPLLGFELPLGVALGAASDTHRHLVLTSDRERAHRRRRTQRLAGVVVSVPLAGLLLMNSLSLRSQSASIRSDADRSEEAADVLSLRLGDLEDTRLQIDQWQAIAQDIESIDDQRLRFGVVVAELAEAMPADSRLVSVQLRRAGEEGNPTAYVGPAPVGLISITGIADDLDGVGRWIEQVDDTWTVDGLWLDQSSFGPLGADEDVGAIFTIEGAITGSARPFEPLVEGGERANTDEQAEVDQ